MRRFNNKVRLVVKQTPIMDNNTGEYWAVQNYADSWNNSISPEGKLMYIEVDDYTLDAVMYFDTDEQAAIYKLSHL